MLYKERAEQAEKIDALTAENAKLKDENVGLRLNELDDEQRQRLDRFIRKHGDLDSDLWDTLIAERDKLREENESLRQGAPLGPIIGAQTIVEQEIELKKLRERVAELAAVRVPVMPRPSTGHPAATHRCGICGGVVQFDGTPPNPECWPAGKKRKEPA